MPRPTRKHDRECFDAGVDWAHDLISQHPAWSQTQLDNEARGSCLDLCGGDDRDADIAYEGAREALRSHFAHKSL